MKASLCPVCMGSGKVNVWGRIRIDWTKENESCHGYNGKGWVEVSEEDDPLKLELDFRGSGQNSWENSKCPACGGDRSSPALTGCPKGSHYGSYCLV